MKTSFSIDHIVIMVDDLDAAIKDYAGLGFTVLPGGSHADNPTHNALIVFADGVYLEIIALRPGATEPPTERLKRWIVRKPGLVDMALLPVDIKADIANARARGVDIDDAETGGRLRPDGVEIAWQTANLKGFGLPFFCADVTSRALRVPEGAVRQHANGVVGVANVMIAVENLDQSTDQYQALLDVSPMARATDHRLGIVTAQFGLNDAALTLAQPFTETSPIQAYLASGGERPYSFTLQTPQADRQGELDRQKTHGAHITLTGTDVIHLR